jgi:hypothetical protein
MLIAINKTYDIPVTMMGPVSPVIRDEFLKSNDEMEADFTYHSYEGRTGRISPEGNVTHRQSVRKLEDPVRLLMKMEAADTLEENY